MDKRNPHTTGAGASKSTAADTETLTQKPAFSQPEVRQFRVIIARDIWRRFVVSTDPATITRQPRSFRDHGEAMSFAEALAEAEGWPIIDRAGGDV